jgi:hypothetical protein
MNMERKQVLVVMTVTVIVNAPPHATEREVSDALKATVNSNTNSIDIEEVDASVQQVQVLPAR